MQRWLYNQDPRLIAKKPLSLARGGTCFTNFFGLIYATSSHYLGMALVDFCQVAVQYKLRRTGTRFLTTHSHPPPMSATTPSPPPSPSVESDQTHSSLPPSTQPEFITPHPCGWHSDEEDEYYADYDHHVHVDLQSRVFVDFEVFMKSVLHVPDDWKTRWGPVIEAVKAHQEFMKHHKEYCEHCENEAPLEGSFYEPLMGATNAVIDVLSRSTFNGFSPGIPQHIRVDESNLSPDLKTLRKDCPSSKTKRPHWTNPLWHALEVTPSRNFACDGRYIPRLVVDGKRAMRMSSFCV